MPIRLSSTTFLDIAQKRVDGYVAWSRNSLPYAFFGGDSGEVLQTLEEALIANGFSQWADTYKKTTYHSNDGRKEGGGFTGIICYYGTMPCMLTLRFFLDSIEVDVWRIDEELGMRPGRRLFFLRVFNTLEVETESFVGNMLKR